MHCGIEDFPPGTGSSAQKEMAIVRETFLSRVRSLMEVLNHSCNFDDGNINNMLTRGKLLYHHAVRLASVNIVEDATIAKLRAVVDLLSAVENECPP